MTIDVFAALTNLEEITGIYRVHVSHFELPDRIAIAFAFANYRITCARRFESHNDSHLESKGLSAFLAPKAHKIAY